MFLDRVFHQCESQARAGSSFGREEWLSGSQFYLAPRSRLQGALAIMRPVYTFSVIPSLPCAIEGLREVAFNLRWSWSHESVELFRWLDQESTDLPSI